MSIAVLTQVYDEVRRLAIAGSVVAAGDFRLQKLIAPLEQAGAKAPVFAKAAQAVTALVESNEQTSSQALLELTTLVNAILYTQGETGLTGEIKPLETTDLGLQTTHVGAQVLKPLVEALTTAGSGRFETIQDGYNLGAFQDLRLVQPALRALDDAYSDIGYLLATTVLPQYGKAIYPQLKAAFNVKGKTGHVRRLTLMYRLDPGSARPLVKQALQEGAKEMRVGAIECLGQEAEDLPILLGHVDDRSIDVRRAVYQALAAINAPEAIAAIKKVLRSSDLELVTHAIYQHSIPEIVNAALEEAKSEFEVLLKSEDQKAFEANFTQFFGLLSCIGGGKYEIAEPFLLECFEQRDLLQSLGGHTGLVITRRICELLTECTAVTRQALFQAHATLESSLLMIAIQAAYKHLSPTEVFEIFSPHFTADLPAKKNLKDAVLTRRKTISEAIAGTCKWYYVPDEMPPIAPWDPRWLDLAVSARDLNFLRPLAIPGHAASNALISDSFNATLQKSRSFDSYINLLALMIHVSHPETTESFVKVLLQCASPKAKNLSEMHWIIDIIPRLPKSAAPQLEALLPELHENARGKLLVAIGELTSKQ